MFGCGLLVVELVRFAGPELSNNSNSKWQAIRPLMFVKKHIFMSFSDAILYKEYFSASIGLVLLVKSC